jgi:hypothetical protein
VVRGAGGKNNFKALLQLKANDLDCYDTRTLITTQILLLTAANFVFMATCSG